MNIIDNYKRALQELYDHVGFKEDWTVFPVEDRTEMFWRIDGYVEGVVFALTKKDLPMEEGDEADRKGNFYSDEIIHHRFYPKSVYRGSDYTMIMVDTHTDGNKFLAFYSNEKEVTFDGIEGQDRQSYSDTQDREGYTTEKYWDCECEKNYIHSKEEDYCEECHARQENQPDSITSEVLKQGFKIK